MWGKWIELSERDGWGVRWNFPSKQNKFSRRFLELVFRAIEINLCHLRASICNIKGKTSVFLFSHRVIDDLAHWADKGTCLFLLILEPKLWSIFLKAVEDSATGRQDEWSPLSRLCFGQFWWGVNQIWCASLSDRLFFPKRRGGRLVSEFLSSAIGSPRVETVPRPDGHSLALWNIVCLAEDQV